METFVAYRRPDSSDVHHLKGNGFWTSDLLQPDTEGIVFCPFSGDRLFFVSDMKSIHPEDFLITNKKDTSSDTKKITYLEQFDRLKKEIDAGRFEKVILSKIKNSKTTLKSLDIFNRLNERYADTFNYVISNAEIGTWIGATPERLLRIDKNAIRTMSLAGTKAPGEEWTQKEYDEQALVTSTILTRLMSANCTNISTEGPSTIKAGQVEHLHTKIEAKLSNTQDWPALLKQLHPTPAVCGIPTKEAREYIPKLEGYNRKFYTGYIGILKKTQHDFFVNLRCMEHYDQQAKLYLGGGIIAASEGEAEWLETERKALTLMNVLH